jgi:hypothetical protein
MQKNYKEKFPQWCQDTVKNGGNYTLCLGDDADSIIASMFIELFTGSKVNYFYNFSNLYAIEPKHNGNAIGVDMDLTKGKCWGNHACRISNSDYINNNCANINNIEGITRSNYGKKYAGSTLLTVLAFYGFDISYLSEEAKKILIAIDASYKGYYNTAFRKQHEYYFTEILEYHSMYEIVRQNEESEFKRIIDKYKLYEKICLSAEGVLETTIDLKGLSEVFDMPFSLPKNKFILHTEFDRMLPAQIEYSIQSKDDFGDVFSFALNFRNRAV